MEKGMFKLKSTVIMVLFALLYLLPLNGRWLWSPDETRYAEISREMLQRGDWIVPHLLGIRYFEKPVAGYWLNNMSQWLLGHTNFAVRFASAFSTALSALLVFWLAMLLWKNQRTALLAATIYLTSLLVYGIGTYSVLDPMVTLWMTAALFSHALILRAKLTRERLLAWGLMGLACGMGFMTKGFLALALPVISVLPVALAQKRIKELLLFGPLAIVVAILLSAPWALAVHEREADYWHYFFWIEHIQRFAEDDAQHRAPFWYYLPVLIIGTFPWLALLPGALRSGWTERKVNPERFFLLCWMVMPLLFFSIAKGKLLTYILPCFAPLALLMAAWISGLAPAVRERLLRINSWLNIAFGSVLALAVTTLGLGIVMPHFYQPGEELTIVSGGLCFIGWIAFAAVSLRKSRTWGYLVAGCPLFLALLVGGSIPASVVDSKNPQTFIRSQQPLLEDSRYVLSDEVGLAAGLAWELKRSDITLFKARGELNYGLNYADAADRFVDESTFPDWLADKRRSGNVALVLKIDRDSEDEYRNLPVPNQLKKSHRYVLLFYKQVAP
ncbi:lipid IV(A) 4-amino-4-deoxy-L-arabinosyltransferase [Pectobacterium zantedeschiae]|uniref:Undecaprenyl phosphate-alpha-4-amino-4-deoxy-L-arabinose arabinosyl transferase n=1 Tax=Pectobacterium zantedeschiae TaxID=2034769 RepID=A0A9X8JJR8_9GAMM|nr:lipid IV(A) 4-amino-4-deoxy-L-arabinosyltransferase [Pectobacterium zantedeschiae]RYC43607.1 lipid IV(A) 4-amino-4-deoxy-L-arabinosyltransferase [Pectobacterium zantedeschiae]RYC49171.1 lipid IV(A) 4-amino-4-deoxy-L-arabinosyltransferase [Pectobacterium zantedeschiae]